MNTLFCWYFIIRLYDHLLHDQATRNLELTYDTNELATSLLQYTTSSIGPWHFPFFLLYDY